MIQEKACEACGTYFVPNRKNQKYCPACGKRGGDICRRIEKEIAHSKKLDRIYNPVIFDNTCVQCGATFKSTHQDRKFCSSRCSKEYKREHLVCDNCGILIKSMRSDISDEELTKTHHYCSDFCEREHKEKLDINRYGMKKCKQCGKTFVSKNMHFCSKECCNAYRKEHPNAFRSVKIQPVLPPLPKMPPVKKESSEAKKKKQQQEYIRQNGLCGICKTPYSKCERMTSHFRIIPKGAKYIDGKIQFCPKYTAMNG